MFHFKIFCLCERFLSTTALASLLGGVRCPVFGLGSNAALKTRMIKQSKIWKRKVIG